MCYAGVEMKIVKIWFDGDSIYGETDSGEIVNQSLLWNYINGIKKPSEDRERFIIEKIHELGEQLLLA